LNQFECIASKIQTYPDEYDPEFPDVPIGDYVLDKMREHGDRVACVSLAIIHLD
jgi:hypothetical protein